METYFLLDLEAKDRTQALQIMSQALETAGAVRSGHAKAILEREEQYSTGLPTVGVQAAIPHAGAEWTNFSALLFCRLKESVSFFSMEDGETELAVKLIFMPAFLDASEHTDVLCRLMQLFQEPQLLQMLCSAENESELRAVLDFGNEKG